MAIEPFGMDPDLAALIASLEAQVGGDSKGGQVAFLKEGDHFLKMCIPQGRTLATFFQPYNNTYNGDVFVYFIVNAIIAKSTQSGLEDGKKVRHIKASKTMIKGIIAQLASWPNLFEEEAPCLKVKIYKEGSQTKYLVTLVNNKWSSADAEWPETTIEEAAKDQEEYSAKQAEQKAAPTVPGFVEPKPRDGKDVAW